MPYSYATPIFQSFSNEPAQSNSPGEYRQQQGELSSLAGSVDNAATELKDEHKKNIAQVSADRAASYEKLNGLYDEIKDGYADNLLDSGELLGDMRRVVSEEVTRMSNSYNNQMAREAERVDALVAGGALGGNAYRAYQAHTQTNRDLLSQATGSIATMVMTATESITTKGIDIASKNQAFYDSTMKLLAGIAGEQVTAMLGFSGLLVQSEGNLGNALANLYNVQLGALSEKNKLYLGIRELQVEAYNVDRRSETNIAMQNIRGEYDLAVEKQAYGIASDANDKTSTT